MKKPAIFLVLIVLASFCAGSQAYGHNFWLLVSDDAPKAGEPVMVEIGWGHKFPKDEQIKEGRLGVIRALGPDGQEVPLKKLSITQYELVPPAKGVYLIAAQVAPDFLTKTKDGFKLQSKKGVTDAVSCFRFDMATKTFVNAGGQKPGLAGSADSSLEIMPLKNPLTQKKGDTFPLRVMFQGKPLAGAEVKVTHDNWPDPQKPFASIGKTDAKGEIRVELKQPGRWLIVTSHKTPYEPPDECDEHYYTASLTFRVR
ncbi:MAG: DUF4198 domain-containing protein [Deltaproteobacteria bacterium]|nr:DUF4198 domain-containing protein [Deltaproteobacteria bacterium]